MKRRRLFSRRLSALLLCTGLLVGVAVLVINSYMVIKTQDRILPIGGEMPADVDCILVLGCLVNDGGVPSDMLHDRLRQSV